MAIELKNVYQKISEINIWSSGSYKAYIRIYGKYNEQSVENNQTSITLEQRFWYNQSSSYHYAFSSATAGLDGTTKSLGSKSYNGSTEYVIQTVNRTINHNADGTSPVRNVPYSWDDSVISPKSGSVDITAPKIDRYPLITNAPNFNDEENPTVQYSTTLGFEGATVSIGIFDSTGTTAYAAYRTVNLENASYTFSLTSTERNALRNATPNSNTMNVMFKLKTSVNGTDYISSSTKILTIVNANPTLSTSIAETNSKIVDILGSSATKLILNASKIELTLTPTFFKGASLKRIDIEYMGATGSITTTPYKAVVNITTGTTINVTLIDSRDNVATSSITWSSSNVIDYDAIDLGNFSFKRQNPTSSNIILNMEARYYQVSFNGTANAPTVKYKVDEGSYVTIPSTEYTIDTANNKLTLTNCVLSNAVAYTTSAKITLLVEDLVTSDTDKADILRGIPVFEKGKTCVQVNGNLYVADTTRQNRVDVLEEIAKCNYYAKDEEIAIGTWDGETLYRKVFTSNGVNGNNVNIAHGITNLGKVIKIDASAKGTGARQYPLNNTSVTLQVVEIDDTNVKMNISTGFGSGWVIHYIMEYTKSSS